MDETPSGVHIFAGYARLKNNVAPLDAQRRFRHARRIAWHETCGDGALHFAHWVRFMEEAEYAFLRSRGLSVILHDERGTIGFPRIQCRVSIHAAAFAEDLIEVQLELRRGDGKQLDYDFQIFRRQELMAEGSYQVACCRFPPNGDPYAILIPDEVLQRLTG